MENKEIMELVEGLKSQIAELEAKDEKSLADKEAQEKHQAELDAIKEEFKSEIEAAKAETKALEAKMQTPEFVQTVNDAEKAETKAAHAKAMRFGVQSLNEDEKKALRTDIDPQGGYLVSDEQGGIIMGRVFETSPLRQVATVRNVSSNALTFILDDDEAVAQAVGEGASGGETDTADIGKVRLDVHKIEADPKITNEELEDADVDVEAWHAGKVASKISRVENTAFINGDGVDGARGILTYPAWASAGVYERNKIEQIASGSASTLTADGLIDLQNSLKEVYQPNAVFLMKRKTWGVISKLKDGENNYLIDFAGRGLATDKMGNPMLLGKPVIFCDDMPEVAGSALPVAYGDFGAGYVIGDRRGLSVLRDPYSSKGFVSYYTTKRYCGGVVNFEAIKLQVVSS